jgi:hypothetical protein
LRSKCACQLRQPFPLLPFTVRGSANSPTSVRRVELWIDGKKVYDSPDDQLKHTVTLAAGTHRIVVQA